MTPSTSPSSAYEPVEDRSLYDALTGLPGRLLQRVCEDLTDTRDLAMVVRRITEALVAPVHVGGITIEVRASIGSALSAGTDQPGLLLNLADRSMSEARRARKQTAQG